MEEELLRFRKQKEKAIKREESRRKLETKWNGIKNWFYDLIVPRPEETNPELFNRDDDDGDTVEEPPPTNDNLWKFILLLKFLFWAFLYMGFLKIGFGAVYFCISLLVLIWRNTGKSKRKRGQPSAYSVFNPNCEALDGSLKAEHFEKQMLFQPGKS